VSPRKALFARERAVLGLDVSLRATGWCVLPSGWKPGDWSSVRSGCLTEQGKFAGQERVDAIVAEVMRQMMPDYEEPAEFVAIESYAFSYAANAITHVAELVGVLKHEIWRATNLEVLPVVASSCRKTLFGKLPRMTRKEIKKHIAFEMGKMGAPLTWSEDERDAFCVANHARLVLALPCLMQA
jgi:Holliday junction resolvasome RuvABC endonuclease subunit